MWVFCNVCVFEDFVMSGCFVCEFCNVWVFCDVFLRVFEDFVMCGCFVL